MEAVPCPRFALRFTVSRLERLRISYLLFRLHLIFFSPTMSEPSIGEGQQLHDYEYSEEETKALDSLEKEAFLLFPPSISALHAVARNDASSVSFHNFHYSSVRVEHAPEDQEAAL
jgi:hypothetical protein